MSPPIPVDTHAPAPVEHHYTLDQSGKPIEIQEVIYIPPNKPDQLVYRNNHLRPDYQLDIFLDLLKAIEDKDIKRIITIIDALPESFRAQTKKLFAEVGELKKKNYQLQLKTQDMQQQIDFLYHTLNIQKGEIHDTCSFCQ